MSASAVPEESFQATGQGGGPGGLAELGMLRIRDTQAATVCKMENQREACCTQGDVEFPQVSNRGPLANSVKNLPMKTTPGLDGCLGEFHQTVKEELGAIPHKHFHRIGKKERIPTSFYETSIFLTQKSDTTLQEKNADQYLS